MKSFGEYIQSVKRASSHNYASFRARLLAHIVDLLITLLAIGMIFTFGTNSREKMILHYVILYVFVSAYFPVLHAVFGQTVGKMFLNIELRTVDGKPIRWKHAILRSSVDIGLSIILLVGIINSWLHVPTDAFVSRTFLERLRLASNAEDPYVYYIRLVSNLWWWSEVLTMLLNPQRRAIHDFLGGTIVVRKIATPMVSDGLGSGPDTGK